MWTVIYKDGDTNLIEKFTDLKEYYGELLESIRKKQAS
jgi:hypothetical protein